MSPLLVGLAYLNTFYRPFIHSKYSFTLLLLLLRMRRHATPVFEAYQLFKELVNVQMSLDERRAHQLPTFEIVIAFCKM